MTYTYKCDTCHILIEKVYRIGDNPPSIPCTCCRSDARIKITGGSGFRFKQQDDKDYISR